MVTREVLDNFQRLVAGIYVTIGQVQGKTLLPLPPVELASADASDANVSEAAAFEATRSIVASLARVAARAADPTAAPALLFLETYHFAASEAAAAQICAARPGRALMKHDPRLCSSFYYMQTTHARAIVPRGAPLVSYRDVAWPIVDHPPGEQPWAARDDAAQQPPDVHARVASVLALALAERAKAALGCDGGARADATAPAAQERSRDEEQAHPVQAHKDMFESEERAAGLCTDDALTVLSPPLGTLERGARADSAAWRYYEDRPGKPGWIFNASAARADEGAGTDTSLKASVKVNASAPNVNIGYLRTYSCMGRVRVWLGTGDDGLCALELDGHWNDSVSLVETADFRPPPGCLASEAARGGIVTAELRVVPVRGSDARLPGCSGAANKFKLVYLEAC